MLQYWDKITKKLFFFRTDSIDHFVAPDHLTDIEPPAPPTDLHVVRWNGVDNWEIINPTEQEAENARRDAAVLTGTELSLRDINGDVRWRIIVNDDNKLQVEADPPDQPHVGEWLLNGILDIPKLENGELLIRLDGDLQAVTLERLADLLKEAKKS